MNNKYNTDLLLKEANKSILFTANRPELVMEHGKGMYLWDTNGKRYLDFIGGWAVTSLGHCPEVITKALLEQSAKLVNASPTFYNVPMVEFAKLLTDNSCFEKVFFASTGAEANEGAIKLARKYGTKFLNGAFEIITATNSFHGRTLATMSATGKKKWEKLFEPKVQGFKHVPLNDSKAIQNAITSKTCSIMVEPVQGEGGVFAVEENYIRSLRELCNEKKILLLFDEVQTGIGRTGKLFAYEHFGIEPDIMTLAKGIGGGYPLAAMLTKEKFDIFEAGDQGGTYSSQPLGMSVGMAVVKEIINKNIVKNAEQQGEYIKHKLTSIANKFNLTNIRGKGLLLAFDLPVEKGSEVVNECLYRGLLINSPRPAYIRLMPPLIVTSREIDEMIEILSGVLADILK
ncbi:Acetylornithine aminotransferase [Sporomusa ovata DSM 2662]|uniref:Acetylornithine aminotransferase n=1 Tax=Sporomusa ovata TaxID=2378 RepID=A0A0U1KVD3_9FIRM|nr:acetylornithine/succinylornithine family transaminase [Sporomusa ovata]EQB26768.1 acetylornithine/succinylornithine aminotransferase [Sporomusa ovata DSM 2662]CQR70863.1 Acetylornithine aminotransferase [Sporomusa ovata]